MRMKLHPRERLTELRGFRLTPAQANALQELSERQDVDEGAEASSGFPWPDQV